MLPLVLFAQLFAAADPIYSTPAVRDLVNGAAIANHAPPPTFAGYRAHIETEFSLLLRDTLGRERTAQVEQLASAVHWTRGASYDMHVLGYRSQSIGSPVSMMSFVSGWTEPSLYGERLTLGVQIAGDTAGTRRQPQSDWIIAVRRAGISGGTARRMDGTFDRCRTGGSCAAGRWRERNSRVPSDGRFSRDARIGSDTFLWRRALGLRASRGPSGRMAIRRRDRTKLLIETREGSARSLSPYADSGFPCWALRVFGLNV